MSKILFILSSILISSYSFAGTPPPKCSCTQSFQDHLGHVSEITLHVACPAVSIFKLECNGQVLDREFSTTCTYEKTGESYSTKISLSAWTNPVGGMTYCELN